MYTFNFINKDDLYQIKLFKSSKINDFPSLWLLEVEKNGAWLIMFLLRVFLGKLGRGVWALKMVIKKS